MTDPLSTEPEAAATPIKRRRFPVQLDRLPTKMLYVEDDDDSRDMVAEVLVDAGFDVTASCSAEIALEHLNNGHFDIIVTDYNLTGETGGWLVGKASSLGYLDTTAVIVLTSERHPPGLEGYPLLRKPVDFGVLLASISEAVGQIVPAEPGGRRIAARKPDLDLVLYVTSTSQESQKAIRNLHRALKPFDKERVHLTIIDVANGGDDAWYQSLEDDRIIVTPTLVKKTPGPKAWIVGTLTPIDAVEELLLSVLGEPDSA